MLPPHCSRRLLSEGRCLASSPHSEYLRQRPGGKSSSSFTVLSLLGRMRDRTLPCRAEARRGQSRWTDGTEQSERDRMGREVAKRRQAWTRRGPVPEWARPRPPSPRPGHRRAGRVLRDGPRQKSRSTSQPSREPYIVLQSLVFLYLKSLSLSFNRGLPFSRGVHLPLCLRSLS